MRPAALGTLLAAAALPLAHPAVAQGYRVRLESRLQTLSFRGAEADSVAASAVVTEPDGSLLSPDGHAVRCFGEWCYFWRAGAEQEAAPWVTSADFSAWGFGVDGLSARGQALAALDIAGGAPYAGTDPPVQLLEGYLEYARGAVTARAGRQLVTGRLGYLGFDGGRATLRAASAGLEVSGYGGWSLARGTSVPWSSPAANPLGDYRPADRLVAAGGSAAWRSRFAEVRAEYQREVDPDLKKLTAERVAFGAALRPAARLSLSGGGEYNLAEGIWGSADATLRYATRMVDVTVGGKRYRPFFPLWTIWAAFSPVAYHSGWGTVQVAPSRLLRLRVRGERYVYEDAEAENPLAAGEDDGWRFSWGATLLPRADLSLDGDYHAEKGPGASSRGWSASASWRPGERFSLTGYAANTLRPLEYRWNEAEAWWYGADASWEAWRDLQFGVGVTRYDEDRARPDAGALDWSQTRLTFRVSWLLDSGADRWRLPPGAMPAGGGAP
ncbi:MAG TPA: hypothetical protein VLA95_00730 [Gemmatimonadales bacterium]|nr:hypothetical protein [Gemmatimonadales bacterium]